MGRRAGQDFEFGLAAAPRHPSRVPPVLFAVLLAILAAAAWPRASHASCDGESAPKSLAGFDTFARAVLADWRVPGLALGIVQDGKTIYCVAYGLGDVENEIPVTPDTKFAIGSITKSFTVAGLALLADEGRLDWDRPVRDVLPDFALADPIATAEATPRDLVTHRTGMARHDMLWYGSGLDRDQLFARLRYLEPGAPFRAGRRYSNLMVAVAGRVTEAVSGESWRDYTARRLLVPLGMTRTDFAVSENDATRAKPYARVGALVRRVAFYDMRAIAPAGAINSSVADMLSYLAFHMKRGVHDGARLLSEAQATAMQTPRVALGEAPANEALGKAAYGMGFLVSTYRGRRIVWHGGAIDGFVALLAFLPDAGIGVVALSNLDRNPTPTILARNVFDRLLRLEPLPWNDWVASDYLAWELERRQAAVKHARARDTAARPSHALTDFTGLYRHPAYGEVRITREGRGLVLSYGQFTLKLRHYRGDIFEIVKIPVTSRAHLEVAFATDESGAIESLAIPFEPAVADIVFTRAEEVPP